MLEAIAITLVGVLSVIFFGVKKGGNKAKKLRWYFLIAGIGMIMGGLFYVKNVTEGTLSKSPSFKEGVIYKNIRNIEITEIEKNNWISIMNIDGEIKAFELKTTEVPAEGYFTVKNGKIISVKMDDHYSYSYI